MDDVRQKLAEAQRLASEVRVRLAELGRRVVAVRSELGAAGGRPVEGTDELPSFPGAAALTPASPDEAAIRALPADELGEAERAISEWEGGPTFGESNSKGTTKKGGRTRG